MSLELKLQELGLTKNESKVYLALLDIGLTTTSEIIKRTGINSSKVYESLDRLLRKGLVSYSLIKNKKNWHAEDPARLKEFLKEEKKIIEDKEKSADALLPLLKLNQSSNDESQYKVFEGIKGIKTARENVLNILKAGETFYIILSNYPKDQKLEAYWQDFQTQRAKNKINCKYILNQSLKGVGLNRKKLSLTSIRYVASEILSPTWIEIYGDHVGIGVLSSKPSIFVIKNQDVANGFLNYFQFLWKSGKP